MKNQVDPRRLLFLLAGIVFAVEFLLMVAFNFYIGWPLWLETFLDAFLLVALLFPVLYQFLFKPLEKEISNERKQTVALESAENTAFITDRNGTIQWVNPSFSRLTGYSAEEAIGKTPRILKSGKLHQDYYEHFWKTILAGNPIRSKVIDRRKDGTLFTADQIVTPVKDDHGNVINFVAIQHDITKDAEIDMAKTEFVSTASHQLRTPLSTINWYTEMLLSGDAGAISDKQKEYLTEVYKGNQRLVSLVNNLLNVSRMETGELSIEPEQVNIKEAVESIIHELGPLMAAKRIQVETHFDDSPATLSADSKLLRIIIQNLVTNAVKYSREGGQVWVDVAKKEADIVFTVTDNGIGIPKEAQDKIFTKLFRADNARQAEPDGTGLGLYIVKSILDKTGGTVRFDSREGGGTTFYVTMPLTGMQKKEGKKGLV